MSTSTDYGKRLIPHILDSLATVEPDRIIYSIAKTSDISEGFRHVSARAFAKAVDKTAWYLHNHMEKSPTIQTVGYIGPHDLRHILLTYACVKANSTALFLSPRNSTEGALAILEAATCNIWVKPSGKIYHLVEEFLQQRTMKIIELPDLDELLDAETADPFPYNKTFEEAINDPFCLLHTSGSTGKPKPLAWSNGLIGTMDAVRLLPLTEGDGGMAPWTTGWDDGDRIYSSFPMSHGAGIIMDILIPCLFRLHCIMGPTGVIPNMGLLDSLAEHAKIDIWSIIPSLVDELGETPDVLLKFRSSKFICASGGPVSPITASKVNDVIRVLNLTGTTEGLFIGNLWVKREDWLYFAFHPFSGFKFNEVEPGIYEHWVHRSEHAPQFQGIFYTFPHEHKINLKDLYIKHPTKPNLWAYKGRNDDIVVLSNGYKIFPSDTEALVTTHPSIEGCIMIGAGRPQAGLLIELKDPTSGNDELFDSIWSLVERANSLSLHKNQLQRDYIAFTEPSKPFIRTDKGTVKRRATLALYAEYIERFYGSRSDDVDERFLAIDTSSTESITCAIRHIFGSLLPALKDAPTDEDIFSLGFDSLLIFRAIKSVRAATVEVPTKSTLPPVPPFPRKFAWPPLPPADGRSMTSTVFLIPPENVEKLRQKVLVDPETKGVTTSIGDVLQAFFWRAAIRARYRVAKELRGESFEPEDISIVEMPIDARPFFSAMLPSSYMGSCLVTNRPYLPVEKLCAPETSLGFIARLFREAAGHVTPSLVHDAFTLLQSIPDYTMLTNACMGLSGMHTMMNNMMLFQTSEISFGGEFFANKGVPDTMRVQMDRFNTAFRLLIIHPMRTDGGIELLLGTLPEEFDMLMRDDEFTEYAKYIG